MAQRGVGTVVTPHKATYIPAQLNPGYCGFLPELRHQYGETYGRATTRHFYGERARNIALTPPHRSMKVPYGPGHPRMFDQIRNGYPIIPQLKRYGPPGEGPLLTTDPVAHAHQSKSDDSYGRNSVVLARSLNRGRIEKLDRMMHQCQDHRRAYKDSSGKTPAVTFFVVPKEFGNRMVGRQPGSFVCEDVFVGGKTKSRPYYRSSNRERAMRDLHFEHR